MLTKVLAAKRAARSGAHTVIASGREADVLLGSPRARRRHAAHRRARDARRAQAVARRPPAGARQLVLDAGAVKALTVARQEPAADRRARGARRIRARRSRELPRRSAARDRARARQLQRGGDPPHPAHAVGRRSKRSWATSTSPSSSTATTSCCCSGDPANERSSDSSLNRGTDA